MKHLLLLLLSFIAWDSPLFAQCDQSTTWVFSLSPGYSKTGPVLSMEGGIWPVTGRFGVMAGPTMYNQVEAIKDKQETITQLDFTGRVVYKITELGNNCPQLFTVFGSVMGNIGASYRGYISLGDWDLLGVEPFYSRRTGPGVNIVYTKKL